MDKGGKTKVEFRCSEFENIVYSKISFRNLDISKSKGFVYRLLIFGLIFGLSGSVSATNCGTAIKTCNFGDTITK